VAASVERYPLRNASPEEADRLASLQSLHDASTVRRLERLGIGPGWHCAELGAGAGSIARFMADRVGDGGSVTAIDRDTTLLTDLGARHNVTVVAGDLGTLDFGRSRFDLVHSRSVLMHLDDADTVLERVVCALRPGGAVLFEEADGSPALVAAARTDLPAPFRTVMVPLASRWTWARGLAERLDALGMVDVHDDVREDLLRGASPGAAFWRQTLRSIRPLVTNAPRTAALGHPGIDDAGIDAMLELLEDPSFEVPFTARHRVSARAVGSGSGPG
jgi:SAM-dependent methyltransferase